jgi:accessory gene regulator B
MIMQHRLSECIADFLLSQKVIKKQEKEIYVYGTQLVISSIINLLICITISLLLGELINGLIFFAIFSSLRRFTGGFHCKTFIMCNVVFSSIVALALLSNTFLGKVFENYVIVMVTAIFNLICILLFSPVYNENKKLTYLQKRRFLISSIIVYAIHIAFYLTLLIVFDVKLNIIVIGDLIVSLMIIWGVINNIVMKK